MSFNPRLALLYSQAKNWTSISTLNALANQYFCGERSESEIADFRARRGHLKKLSDEIVPTLRYLATTKTIGEIFFDLGNGVPDCWLRIDVSSEPIGLEITIAQAREQQRLGEELNERGIGRGFVGLPDDAPSRVYDERFLGQRAMYSTKQALSVIGHGIAMCLEKKNKPKYAGFDLLVEAPLRSLPRARWDAIQPDLRNAASDMPFRRIFVVSNESERPYGFFIK